MKYSTLVFGALAITALFSCGEITHRELYTKTDHFVEQLSTQYESYGILAGDRHKVLTSDGKYQVMPVGRLINVKILEVVEDDTYRSLRDDLASHYRGDQAVRDVYIASAGTVMIDCRN